MCVCGCVFCVLSIVRRTTVLLPNTLVPMVVLKGKSLENAVSVVASTVAWTAKHLAMAVFNDNARTYVRYSTPSQCIVTVFRDASNVS